jgi:hypothetical protein
MHDGEQRHGARRGSRLARWRLQRLELAPGGAVNDIPPARAQPPPDGVGRFEILVSPELDALSEQLLRFFLA